MITILCAFNLIGCSFCYALDVLCCVIDLLSAQTVGRKVGGYIRVSKTVHSL
ncbi:hypothetical protein [Paenibacillus sp. FSL R5-0473]|uniref:hypothetical protein n=1 Tax=Paenibacillus sp. FSL R5-0473 TaxID=2921642 RepID=UPI0030F7CE22